MHVSETASEPKADQQLSRQSRDRNHTWRVCSGLTSGFCRHRKFINCVSCQAFHPFPSHMPQCVCPNQFIIQPWNLTHSRDVLQEEFSLLWQSTFCAFLGNILKSNLCICPLCALAMLLGWQKHTKLLLSSCWEWWHKGGHSLPSSFHAGIQIYNKQHQHKFTSVFYVLLYISIYIYKNKYIKSTLLVIILVWTHSENRSWRLSFYLFLRDLWLDSWTPAHSCSDKGLYFFCLPWEQDWAINVCLTQQSRIIEVKMVWEVWLGWF